MPRCKYKNFRRGGHVLSLDELSRQELVFWRDRLCLHGWFLNWQFKMTHDAVGPDGVVYYAIKEEQK